MRTVQIILALIFFYSCSSYQSTLNQPEGQLIFTLDEKSIFNIVYTEMKKVMTDAPVSEIDGPTRGYHSRQTLLGDHYDINILITPVIGKTVSNDSHKGYFVELKGSGNIATNRPATIFKNIISALKKTKTETKIVSYERDTYQLERERWKLKEASPRNDNDHIKRLRNAKKLYDEGILTKEEYLQKKKELLKSL